MNESKSWLLIVVTSCFLLFGCSGASSEESSTAQNSQESSPASRPSVEDSQLDDLGDHEYPDENQLVINITAPVPQDADPKIWTEEKRKAANKMSVAGENVDFVQLYKYLETQGVKNKKYRDPERPNLSTRRALIRCEDAQTFDYAKAILQIFASPEIAIYRIQLATPDRQLTADLPVDLQGEGLEELAEEGQDEEERQAKKRLQAEIVDGKTDRFTTVKLVQKKASRPGQKLIECETGFFFGDEELVAATRSEALDILGKKLHQRQREHPTELGQIDAARGVPFGAVMDVLSLFQRARFETTTFLGQHSNHDIRESRLWWQKTKDALKKKKVK